MIAMSCLCKIANDYTAFLFKKKKRVSQEAGLFRAGTLLRNVVCTQVVCALCLKVFETCICAVPMLGKQLPAVHLITGRMHRTASFFENCDNLQGAARECISHFHVSE